jgi:hypothetical protein
MELLVIKIDKDYVRVKDGDYLRCQLDKASVFPMDQLEIVKQHVNTIKASTFSGASVYRLIMNEEPFPEMT